MSDARARYLEQLGQYINAQRGGWISGAPPLFFGSRPGIYQTGPDLLMMLRGRWYAIFVPVKIDGPLGAGQRKSIGDWIKGPFADVPAVIVYWSGGRWYAESATCEQPDEWTLDADAVEWSEYFDA